MEPINVQETVISELEEEKGNFLCGPEWKVKITTKAGQELDIKQVSDGDFIKHSRQSLHLPFTDRRWARFQGSYFSPAPKSRRRG